MDKSSAFQVTISPTIGQPEKEQRFEPVSEYRDKPFTVLFLLHLLVTFGLLVGGVINRTVVDGDDIEIFHWTEIGQLVGVTAVCGVVGLLFSAFYMFLINRMPKVMIVVSCFAFVGFFLALSILFFVLAIYDIYMVIFGSILLLCTLLIAACVFLWRKKIPFNALLLSVLTGLLTQAYCNYVIAFASVFVYLIWFLVWSATVLFSGSFMVYSPYIAIPVYLWLVFSWFWATQVIRNVVHTTVAGSIATWYFMSDISNKATTDSLKRALTTSFGSICFGSLIVAIIMTLRFLSESMIKSDNLIAKIIGCFLKIILVCLQGIMQFINKYAFIQVAIYGKPYIEACKSTFDLLKRHGVDVVMNDLLIGFVVFLGVLSGSLLTMSVALGVTYLITEDWNVIGACMFFGFFIGLGIIAVAFEVLDSATATLLVCMCEEPAVLQRNFPDLFEEIRTRYGSSISLAGITSPTV